MPDPGWTHQHCGSDDSCSDEHNDWVSDLTGQIMKLLGLGDDDLTPPSDEPTAPHFRNDAATADELALVESVRTEVGL